MARPTIQAAYLDSCTKPIDRSFYSCAEAQALAKLLARVGSTIDFRKIEFRRPSSDDGHLLWEPCDNCQMWLEEKSGGGSGKVYKLREVVLNRLCPKVVTTNKLNPSNYNSDFPSLS